LQSFANACVTLLDNSDTCNKLGLSARKKAIQLYERNNVIQLIQQTINKHLGSV